MERLAPYLELLAPIVLVAVTLLCAFLAAYVIKATRALRALQQTQETVRQRARALEAELGAQKEAGSRISSELDRLRQEADDQRAAAEITLAETVERADRLKKLNLAKSRFMAGMSARFRTPLTLIINPLEDIVERTEGDLPRDVEADLNLALRNARRLMLFLGQILDISKLDAGKIVPRPVRLDLREVLTDLSLSFTPWAERKKIQFRLDLPEEKVIVHLDPDLVRKALVNLTTASFKVTPADGTIRITLKPAAWLRRDGTEDAFVTIQVKDTGPGIPPDEIQNLFDPFFYLESSHRAELSVGVEFPLAKELVELQNGFLDVASEVGFGTEISVYLRASDTIDASASPRSGGETFDALTADPVEPIEPAEPLVDMSGEGDSSGDRTTVLVVEDNEDVQMLLRRILEPELRVVVARDGQEGLKLTTEVLPDLVLSDVMMPGMDGFELCQRLKQDPELAFIPVILLTAKADVQDRVEGLKEGADDYIVKPFDRAELKARVHNLIARRKRIKDRFSKELELHASDIEVVSSDETFVRNVQSVIEAHIDDEDFSVEDFAGALGMSRGHLHRRLKTLLNVSPSEAVRNMRLERAKMLLEGHAGTVSEVAYRVGFRSVSHFCRCFKEAYGCTPAEMISEANHGPNE